MKVISTNTVRKTCDRCDSVIEMFKHEMQKVGLPGPYETDCYEPSEVGNMYWMCPVCGKSNWVHKDDLDEF